MKLRFFGVAGAAVVFVGVGAGCSADPRPQPGGAASSEEIAVPVGNDGGIPASCTNPNRYIAVLNGGPCVEVAGAGGSWIPSPVFAHAPAEFHACFYDWSGGVVVDKAALVAFAMPSGPGALSHACGAPGQVAKGVAADALEGPSLVGTPGGAVGCDVCAYVDDNGVFIVLPPEEVVLGEFSVATTSGALKTFKVDMSAGIRAATFTLPPLPTGDAYVEGPTAVH